MRFLLFALVFSGCGLNLEEPTCHSSGACFERLNNAELAYTQKVLSLLGGEYNVTIELYESINSVSNAFNTRYGQAWCVAGFSPEGEVHSVPAALSHELTHYDVFARTGLEQTAELSHEDQGWTDEDHARASWAAAEASVLLPYEIEQGCK